MFGLNVNIVSEKIIIARRVLGILRNKNANIATFRSAMRLAGLILALETSRELEWEPITIETPLGVIVEEYDLKRQPLLIGILGASIHMLEGFQQVYEEAPVALLAAKRVEEHDGVNVKVYYERFPANWNGPTIIVDPMLATGTTIGLTIKKAKELGSGKVIIASIISSVQGLKYITEKYPEVTVYTLTVDPELNSKFFIVPGLGDAGDRALGVLA